MIYLFQTCNIWLVGLSAYYTWKQAVWNKNNIWNISCLVVSLILGWMLRQDNIAIQCHCISRYT